jgi:hypothetical protein
MDGVAIRVFSFSILPVIIAAGHLGLDRTSRPHEDAIRVLEAVGAHASPVDKKTARRALQFTTQVLRNLFEIPSSGGGS